MADNTITNHHIKSTREEDAFVGLSLKVEAPPSLLCFVRSVTCSRHVHYLVKCLWETDYHPYMSLLDIELQNKVHKIKHIAKASLLTSITIQRHLDN